MLFQNYIGYILKIIGLDNILFVNGKGISTVLRQDTKILEDIIYEMKCIKNEILIGNTKENKMLYKKYIKDLKNKK